MKTVKQMKEELDKFPDDAQCYAYEGEVIGLVVIKPDASLFQKYGVIYCSEGDDDYDDRHPTETLDEEQTS